MPGFEPYNGPKYFYQAGSSTVALDAAAGFVDLSDTGADIAWPLSSSLILQIASTSTDDVGVGGSEGTGARTVRILGLDTNYEFVSQDAILNGTTDVDLATSLIAALDMRVLTAGSGATSAGDINLELTGDAIIYTMLAGENHSSFGSFVVPEGCEARLLRCGASINSADGIVPDVQVRLLARVPATGQSGDLGAEVLIESVFDKYGIQSLGNTSSTRKYKDMRFPPRTAIWQDADTDLDNTIVHGFLELEILMV